MLPKLLYQSWPFFGLIIGVAAIFSNDPGSLGSVSGMLAVTVSVYVITLRCRS